MRFSFFSAAVLILALYSCRENQVIESGGNPVPDPPLDLSVFAAYDGEVGIEWVRDQKADLKGFNIYRSINDTLNFTQIGFTSDNYFIDKFLEYNITYSYRVTAVDKYAVESRPSRITHAKPANLYPPSVPQYILINGRNWNDTIAVSLSWNTSPESDLSGYMIYRDTTTSFSSDSAEYSVFTNRNVFLDRHNLKLLKKYYYKISAVDKGNLSSKTSGLVSDLILNKPTLNSPADGITITDLKNFRFRTCSKPAAYRLVIQNDEFSGPVAQLNFSSDITDSLITVDMTSAGLSGFRKYYWRVMAFTGSSDQPNSISGLFSFVYNPAY